MCCILLLEICWESSSCKTVRFGSKIFLKMVAVYSYQFPKSFCWHMHKSITEAKENFKNWIKIMNLREIRKLATKKINFIFFGQMLDIFAHISKIIQGSGTRQKLPFSKLFFLQFVQISNINIFVKFEAINCSTSLIMTYDFCQQFYVCVDDVINFVKCAFCIKF